MTNSQQSATISNAHVGSKFEKDALAYFNHQKCLSLTPNFPVNLGIEGKEPKTHKFDLGCDDELAVLVECKSHTWTASGNIPSAKITVWNEAMYYFLLAPKHFTKVLFVLESSHKTRSKTLAQYYVDINEHLIPNDVSIVEFNQESTIARYVKVARKLDFKLDI
jgi:hypothetical protein